MSFAEDSALRARLRRFALRMAGVAVLLAWLISPACSSSRALAEAEQAILGALELDALEEAGDSAGFDVSGTLSRLLAGDLDPPAALAEMAGGAVRAVAGDLGGLAASLAVPVAVSLLARLALPGGASARRTVRFVCRAASVAALAGCYAQLAGQAEALMDEILRCSDALAPAMIAAVALSGAETTAAALTPMSAVCADLIQNLLCRWGIALSSAAAGIAIAGNLSDGIPLKRLYGLFRQVMQWGTGLLLAAFFGALTIQGRLGAGRDSVAARTARYAIESLVPVIGGNVSDSLDSLLSTAFSVKNALGATGLALLIAASFAPVVRIALTSLALKVVSAVSEPLGDDGLTAMAAQFAGAAELLLVACLAALLLCAMLTGSCMSAAGNVVR